MPPPWVSMLELIRNGEAVAASVTNRPINQLAQRTEYLKSLLDLISSGGAIYKDGVAMSPDVQEGFVVYWNAATQEYAPALAVLDYDSSGVYGGNADSAYALGICAAKSAPTSGMVIFAGSGTGVDFSAAVDGGVVSAGPYFLSATQPGHMTKDRPPVGIYVMFGTQDGCVIAPSPREVLENHVHYKIPLQYGTIVDDSGGAGWTSVFDSSLAPTYARYRYIEEADAPVHNLFPFTPAEGVFLETDGVGANDKIVVNLNGIWWVSEVTDPDDFMNIILYFAKPTAATNSGIVHTLSPWTADSPIKIVNCRGEDATSGDLKIKFDLVMAQGGDTAAGWLAFKELTAGGQFVRGPITQNVRSASPEISISLAAVEGVPQGGTNPDGSMFGNLVLTYNSPTAVARSLEPTLTELFGALQEEASNIPYVALPSGAYQPAVSFRFDVPRIGLTGDFTIEFLTWLYATTSGTMPTSGLTVTFTIVRSVTTAAAKLITNPVNVITITGKDLDLYPNGTLAAASYRLASCADIDSNVIQPGDQVHVRVTRQDVSYAGSIGIMKAWCEITQA